MVKKYPQIFQDVKIFFVRYNDPSFVKHEKLQMIYSVTNESNYKAVLNELNEYAYDMDQEFNIQTIRIIWKLALKISESLNRYFGSEQNPWHHGQHRQQRRRGLRSSLH